MLLLNGGGAEPNSQRELNHSIPVQTALKKRNLEGVKPLVRRGADLNQTTAEENASIMAVEAGDDEAVGILLDLGANVNQLDFSSTGTAPNVAITRGDGSMSRILLSRGADPNIQGDGDVSTPLQTAVKTHNLPGAALLTAVGADPKFASNACPSALELVVSDRQQGGRHVHFAWMIT